jgi:DNA-directed RNA polymerase subunit H (RpoH/RPB5)
LTRETSIEEKRAQLIIKYRDLEVKDIEEKDGIILYRLLQDDNLILMHVIKNQSTIGIAYIRELREEMEKEDSEKGIIVSDGKYTYSARSNAPGMDIELIPQTIPTFDIFEHRIVPIHEIVSKEEREKLVERYHAEAYQFPWIKSTDPISIILGARPGDVLRITQKSETAGRYDTYRYVV